MKYNKIKFLFIPFFSGWRTGQTRGWIFTRDSASASEAKALGALQIGLLLLLLLLLL